MKPMLIVMVGISNAGKSTKAEELQKLYNNCRLISSDQTRIKLNGDINDISNDVEVFKHVRKEIREALLEATNKSAGENVVIYDACNITYKKRMGLLNEVCRGIDCEKVAYMLWRSLDEIISSNEIRGKIQNRPIPKHALINMYERIWIPQLYEGWDQIIIEPINCYANKSLSDLFSGKNGLCSIPHDNPHHTLSIGGHIIECFLNICKNSNFEHDKNLLMAALLHDIGKPFTKKFKDSKGNPTEIAHYYQHHIVSGYEAIPYLMSNTETFSFEDVLEIVAIIQWHMLPYQWEKDNNEKLRNKYKKLWGDELYEKIMLLHEADKKAH